MKKRLVYGAIIFIWIAIPAHVTNLAACVSTDIVNGTCIPWSVFSNDEAATAVKTIIFLTTYLIPLTLMVFFYSRIVYVLRHKVSL